MESEKKKSSAEKLQMQVRERILGYITAALGLIAGLAWNDAVKTGIEMIFPTQNNTITAKFIYAIVMTIVVVVISIYLARILKLDKN